jgi:hypothetical protein
MRSVKAKDGMVRKILFRVAFVAVFISGVLFAGISHFSSPIVTINFINKSSKEIKSLEIIHRTGRSGEITHSISNLGMGKERQIRMWVPAESSYELVVAFADQRQITGGQGYIEPGYTVRKQLRVIELNLT